MSEKMVATRRAVLQAMKAFDLYFVGQGHVAEATLCDCTAPLWGKLYEVSYELNLCFGGWT